VKESLQEPLNSAKLLYAYVNDDDAERSCDERCGYS